MATATQGPDTEKPEDSGKNPGQEDFDNIISRNFSPGDERAMEDRAQKGAAEDRQKQDESPDAGSLGNSEREAAQPSATGGEKEESDRLGEDDQQKNPRQGWYNAKGDQMSSKNVSRLRAAMAGARGKVYYRGGIAGVIISIAFLLLASFGHGLKLPHFQSSIERRAERVSRDFQRNASVLTTDAVAMQSDPSAYAKVKAQYSKMRSATWGKLDKYRPNKVVQNLKATGVLDFEYANGPDKPMTAVIWNKGSPKEQRIPAAEIKKFNLLSNYSEKMRFAGAMLPNIRDAVTKQGVNGLSSFIVYTKVSKTLLKAFGINLSFWDKAGSAFRGAKSDAALALQEQQDFEKVKESPLDETNGAGDAKTQAINDAAKEAEATLESDLKSPETALAYAKSNVLPANVQSAITKGVNNVLGNGLTGSVVGFLNPIYSIGAPICMIYDGSTSTSKSFMDAQHIASVRFALGVMSAADQQKRGAVSAEAVGAFDTLLGEISSYSVGLAIT